MYEARARNAFVSKGHTDLCKQQAKHDVENIHWEVWTRRKNEEFCEKKRRGEGCKILHPRQNFQGVRERHDARQRKNFDIVRVFDRVVNRRNRAVGGHCNAQVGHRVSTQRFFE